MQRSPLYRSNRKESEGGRGSFSWCYVIAMFSTSPQKCDPPRRTKDSPAAQLPPRSRAGLHVVVEEEIGFFTLWHFLAEMCHGVVNCRCGGTFRRRPKTLWGLLCFTLNAG